MKFVALSLTALIVVSGVLTSLPTYAQEAEPEVITEEQISRIKASCQTTAASLSRIHASDGPVYVNRNQTYFSISDKLIARLNSRLALNRHDTTQFARIAKEYNAALTQFRTSYKQYDDAMAELIKMNCSKQPVSFYDKISEVRELRSKVHASVAKLHLIIDQYREAVGALKLQLKGASND